LGRSRSLGLYLGRDQFGNKTGGRTFSLTHLSAEIEISPWMQLCPRPSLHIGVGSYRDEFGHTNGGFNVGAGLAVCLNRRMSFVSRYDYRSVNSISRNYSTLQIGLRWNF